MIKKMLLVVVLLSLSGCVSMKYLKSNYSSNADIGYRIENNISSRWENYFYGNGESDPSIEMRTMVNEIRKSNLQVDAKVAAIKTDIDTHFQDKLNDLQKTSDVFRWLNMVIDGKLTYEEFKSLLLGKIELSNMKGRTK